MFSATDRSGSRLNSWKTVERPACWAWTGWPNDTVFAVDLDGAGVGLVHAGEDLHQRGLAGAVLADEAEDLAGAQLEVDVVGARRCRRSCLVRPRASSTTSGTAAPDPAGRVALLALRHGVTVARVTHFCREFGKSCLLDVTKSRVVDFRRADQRRLRAAAGRASPGRAPSWPSPAGWPAPRSPPGSRCCCGSGWWCRTATGLHRRATAVAARLQPQRPGRRRRRHRRHPRPRRAGRPGRAPSSASAAPTSTSPTGPEDRAGLGGARDRRAARGRPRGPSPSSRPSASGLPGPVEHSTGRAINPPIMPGWDRYDVPAHVRARSTCRC